MRYFLSIAALCLSLPAYAQGPDTVMVKQIFQDWEVNCAERGEVRECSINQQIRTQANEVIAVVNGTISKDGATIIEFGLPVMMDLTTPVSLPVDGQQLSTLEYNTCNNRACFIVREDDEVLLKSFREGETSLLTMESYAGQSVQIAISLRGFSDAIDSLMVE